jgi:hypothetical protein
MTYALLHVKLASIITTNQKPPHSYQDGEVFELSEEFIILPAYHTQGFPFTDLKGDVIDRMNSANLLLEDNAFHNRNMLHHLLNTQ